MTAADAQLPARQPGNNTAAKPPRLFTPPTAPPRRPMLRRLRGREPWLLLAVACGAFLGAAIGWASGSALYRATALLQITWQPPTTSDADRATAQEFIAEHLAAQTDLLLATRAQLLAADPAVVQHPLEVHEAAGIRNALDVALLAPTPDGAKASLQRILDAYVNEHNTQRHALDIQIDKLENRRDDLHTQLNRLTRQIADESRAFGPIPLDQAAAARIATLRETEDLLAQTGVALAAAVQPTADDRDATLQQLARSDETLRALMHQTRVAEDRLASLRRTMGPNALAVREAVATAESARARIDEHLRATRAERVATPGGAGSDQPVLLATRDELQTRRDALIRLRDTITAELQDIQRRQVTVKALGDQASTLRTQLAEVEPHVEHLLLQRQIAGTLRAAPPAAPAIPYTDSHRNRALIGAATGIVAALCLTPLALLADNRIRRAEAAQLDDPTAPLFGAVPTLDEAGLSGDAGDAAALAIHEIRALMQIRAQTHGARAFAITSPTRGAGKTSLTVGLASSLALSGTRTLLVDCDLAQRHTPVNPPAKKPGDAGSPGAAASPASALNDKQNLDQVMLQMGYLDDSDPEVFLLSHDQSVGITGLLEGQPLPHCIIETSVPGLSILPALSASSQHIARMSSAFVRRLIEDAKLDYDMVIFDTGPVPGSVEALVVTSEADAVILVVPRGEFRHRFEKAVSYLHVVGAPLIGTVFNRAGSDDLTVEAPISTGKRKSPAPTDRPQRITGSGLLAAAVHVQSHQEIHPQNGPRSRAETERTRAKPGAKLPAQGSGASASVSSTKAPSPAKPKAERGEAPDSTRPPEITLADAGDITAILDNTKPANGRLPKPAPKNTDDSGPAPQRSKPSSAAFGADEDLEQALDELVNNARATPPPSPRRPAPAGAPAPEPTDREPNTATRARRAGS